MWGLLVEGLETKMAEAHGESGVSALQDPGDEILMEQEI